MPDDRTPSTDDRLAAAARHCWACECAPADLRRRLAEQIASGRRRLWGPQWVIWPVATAAAAIVVAVTGSRLPHRPPAPSAVAAVLPASLQAQLVQTHDRCSHRPDHQRLPVAKSDGYAIAANLRSQLNRPVLVSQPADERWRFAGAAVCAVGDVKSAHLVFRRSDGDTLSIFSLPRSSAPDAADGQQFQSESDRHPIVAFVKHRAVYCLVGSGCAADVSVAQLADLRRQLESQVVVADGPSDVVAPGSELMHVTDR